MKVWMWWPFRILKWFYGLDNTPCNVFMAAGPSKEQPFKIVLGNHRFFYWATDLSEEGMKTLINNLQSRLDQYEIFEKAKE